MSRLIAATPLVFVGQWATRSQEQARRNAMAACTVLAARRLEHLEVQTFIAEHLGRPVSTDTTAPATAPMLGVG
jgi:hypothetical protein